MVVILAMGDPLGPELLPFLCFMSTLKLLILKVLMHMEPGRYLIFFLIKFPVECRRSHVWRPNFDPDYYHFYKCDHFGNKCPACPGSYRPWGGLRPP